LHRNAPRPAYARRHARPRRPVTVRGRRGHERTAGLRPVPPALWQGRGHARQALGWCHAPRPHTPAVQPPPAIGQSTGARRRAPYYARAVTTH
jgi:hypothetical protein